MPDRTSTHGAPAPARNGRRRITRDEWLEEGKRRFGPDVTTWRFRCVSCGHAQNARDMMERNPDLTLDTLRTTVFFSCEGRFTAGIGCDWTLGGLFHIHTLEVQTDSGAVVPVFEFAEPDGAP